MTDRPEKLQKVIARTGFASRRKAEEVIAAGRVRVDGVIAQLGQRVEPEAAIEIDGVPLPTRPGLVYLLVNKPLGTVASVSDPQGRQVVVDLVDTSQRIWPVGRLDVDSEGLLILTNDGELTNRLTHPRYGVRKSYLVLVDRSVSTEQLNKLTSGVVLEDGPAAALSARIVDRSRDRTLLELSMGEGRNREIRRMCAALGLAVTSLFRQEIGPISDKNLRAGEARPLTIEEVRALYSATVVWVIAIDGPGGSGKSTVASGVGDQMGLPHLDTGAYYRAATLAVLEHGLTPDDPQAAEVVAAAEFHYTNQQMTLDGRDVSSEIRQQEVTWSVSAVSAIPAVRKEMVRRQRQWVSSRDGRAVVEGRDIGTVVFPEARLKIFLTARPEVRAARRHAQMPVSEPTDVISDLTRRDELDSSRAMSPLQQAHDAVVIDTSDISSDQVISQIVDLGRDRGF